MCGAEYPLKVSALGESSGSFGFADDDLRPPGNIGNQPRWPVSQAPPQPYPPPYSSSYPDNAQRQPLYNAPGNGPVSLTAPGVPPDEDDIELPPEGRPGSSPPVSRGPYPPSYPIAPAYPPRDRAAAPYPARPGAAPYTPAEPLPRLGPVQGDPVASVGPVAVKPAATLACPLVSVLDHWLADSVQPAAQRWFGARVVEIKQISAYSCRGMNGNPHAHISEHAFGNALDIAAFTLADGRRISVKDGWKGLPEEQGFLRDVQAAGLPAVHHRARARLQRLSLRSHPRRPDAPRLAAVDLRTLGDVGRGSRGARGGTQPLCLARALVTGSLGGTHVAHVHKSREKVNEEDEFENE